MNRDFAILQDGTRKLVDDFGAGELLVACKCGEVRTIVHFRGPRPFGAWHERNTKPLTPAQVRCVEGQP